MLSELFVVALAVLLAGLFRWGFKTLPGEEWQVIGCLLGNRDRSGSWKVTNLTYYGFFNATGYLLAALVFFVLVRSLHLPPAGILVVLILVLAICMPASRLVAFWVEGKTNTFTVGGASFIGLIAAPWIVQMVNGTLGSRMGFSMPVLQILAAVSIAYALGEGAGRLVCISFGCCYGKPLSECRPSLQRIFRGRAFIFSGATKKIAYAHHLDGQEVIPIQAITAVLLTGTGLIGCYAFLRGFPAAAFLGTLSVTQSWRIISEFFRADERGAGRMTAYQCMAFLSVGYAFLLPALFPVVTEGVPDLAMGLLALWDPAIILCFQILWAVTFLYTGRSRVTSASVHLHVLKEET